jgi:preprotein translocase subunit SecG
MYGLILSLHIIVCLILVVIVLLHGSKDAGLGNTFGGGGQSLFGVRGPASFLSKLVAGAAGIFMVTSLVLSVISNRSILSSRLPDEVGSNKPVTNTTTQTQEKVLPVSPKTNVPIKVEIPAAANPEPPQ